MTIKYKSSALEAGNVATSNFLDELVCTNTSGGVLYLHIFLDATALPADTAVPDVCIAVPANSTVGYDPQGTRLPTGGSVAFCLSSTAATKTVAGSVGVFTVR
jgi:hypothetical protein